MIGVPVLVVLEKVDSADHQCDLVELSIWIFFVPLVASVVGTQEYKALLERWHLEAADEWLPSADSEGKGDESVNKSGQLSAYLFSLNWNGNETEHSGMKDSSVVTPTA